MAKRTKSSIGHRKGQPLRFVNGHNTRLRIGEQHPQWRGENAGYMAIHNWLRRTVQKTGACAECRKEGKTDWANISGDYRRDPGDYVELCRSCHMRADRYGAQLHTMLAAL